MRIAGRLFVFEGYDNSGKTTLAKALHKFLKRRDPLTKYFAFPGNVSGTLGRHIHRLHHNAKRAGIAKIHPVSLQILHIAAHVDMIETLILPALKRGESVVLDRYWWSTLAYGIAS